MRVLFACHRLPYPPKRGGKIRPFNIIRHLAEQGHSLTVGSLARSDEEIDEGRDLRKFCDKLHIGRIGSLSAVLQMIARLPSASPSSMGYFYSAKLHRMMRAELENGGYDLVFVHCSSAAQYVRANRGTPSILDFGDMDSQKWLDYVSVRPQPLAGGYWLEGKKLRRAERSLAREFDVCTCTTRAELATLNETAAARRTDWFANGVDAEFFSPTERPYDPNLICFVGRMDYFPNRQAMLYFCREILPALRSARPDIRLKIVGAEPAREIQRLGERPDVEVTGTVADVRDHVRSAAVSVAPLRIARGTQNKILESMAMGIPVVCSDAAAGGVDAESGVHLHAAASTDDFVDKVLRILTDPAERNRFAKAGRERVLTHHSWRSSMQKLDEIITSTVSQSL